MYFMVHYYSVGDMAELADAADLKFEPYEGNLISVCFQIQGNLFYEQSEQ